MPRFTVDTSYYQDPVDDSYTRDWFSFRLCDGDFIDPVARHNLAWAIRRRASGQLRNFEVYVVYRPGKNGAILDALRELRVPTDCVIKSDTESWNGKIRGNHSTEINSLLTALRARQGKRSDLVVEYANRGDFANVHPSRMAWCPLWIAAYSSVKPDNPGPGPLAGWQYTDGEAKYPVPAGWPRSSAPFGRCDHNVVYLAPLPTVKPPPPPVIIAKPPAAVPPAAPLPDPLIQEEDMFVFYVPIAGTKNFTAWERGPGIYKKITDPDALRPLQRGGAKRVDVTAAEHAATLAQINRK